ncbi:MAG: hemerythrin family protein [Deltaproteobacteria bacterium]|nr:hemerythrin family protein [Deltaproteobacteria bacterium]
MSIEWSGDFSTGVPWQDSQHKGLFRSVNSLLDAMSIGRGKEEVQRLFKFLHEYFVVHFHYEEEAMHLYKYPDAVSHIKEHTGFIEDISRLEKEAESSLTTGLVIQVQKRVIDWLADHIGGADKSLGKHIVKVSEQGS